MKIAYLSVFYPYRGGIAQFNANLYRELVKTHQVKAFNFKRQYPGVLFPGKTQRIPKDDQAVFIESTPVLDSINPFSYGHTARQILKYNPDLLLMRYWMPFFAPSLGWVARRLNHKGCTVVSIVDNLVPHERTFMDKTLSHWFLKQNHGCIAMSRTVRDDILSLVPKLPYVLKAHPLYDHFGAPIASAEAKNNSAFMKIARHCCSSGSSGITKAWTCCWKRLRIWERPINWLSPGKVTGVLKNTGNKSVIYPIRLP